MKKENKIIAWVIFGLIVLIVAYVVYKHHKTNPPSQAINPADQNKTDNFTDAINKNIILTKGMKGNNIKELQRTVNEKINLYNKDLTSLVVDGVFGNATEKAVQQISCGTYTSDSKNISIAAISLINSKMC